jgi:hypothetical protein
MENVIAPPQPVKEKDLVQIARELGQVLSNNIQD